MIFLQLFYSYLKIGFFGFGGGYAMLSLIQNEIVVQNGWITNAEFADIVAISQITPGPIAINSATYIGYTVGAGEGGILFGILGVLVATITVSLPSLTIMVLLTKFFMKMKNNKIMAGAMMGMSPVVIGTIIAAALLLAFPKGGANSDGAAFIDAWSWAIFAGATLLTAKNVSPIYLIILSAIAGIAIYYLPTVM